MPDMGAAAANGLPSAWLCSPALPHPPHRAFSIHKGMLLFTVSVKAGDAGYSLANKKALRQKCHSFWWCFFFYYQFKD